MNMQNLLKYLAKARGLSAVAVVLTTSLLASFAHANSVWDAVEAGHLTWSGNGISTNWVSGDLVITFTDTTKTSTLHLPGWTKAWALAVGGGGSGGAGCTAQSNYRGGAGGGGAGGYVENTLMMLQGGEGTSGNYTIAVGAGGLAKSNDAREVGNDGKSSSITYGGAAIADFPAALGGGGGGAECGGNDGGSGGGGSQKRATASRGQKGAGGATTQAAPGVGNAGGASGASSGSYKVLGGAGGGGASEAGGTNTGTAGKGGAGKASEITGTTVTYAGGGGGAIIETTTGLAAGAGGAGGGGAGGDGTRGGVDGTDGLGGGGGGSSSAGIAGKGGDGVVIVRISLVVDGPIEKPTYKELSYTGKEQTIAETIPGVYTVKGVNKAMLVNETPYEYTVELEPGLKWKDGTDEKVTAQWRIVPGKVAPPTPLFKSVVYDGKSHTVVYPVPNMSFVAGSHTNETVVGEYAYTTELDDKVNYRWTDGSVTNMTFAWSITPRTVTVPPLPQGLVYSGTNNVAVTNSAFYSFGEGSVTNATDAGTYSVVYQLNDPKNSRWADGSVTNLTYRWTIARLPVAKPPVPGEGGALVYNGKNQNAATNSTYYTFSEGSTIVAKKAGDYHFEAVLRANFCWKDESGEAATDPYYVKWWITQAPNKINSLSIGDWKLGSEPRKPTVTADFGATTVQYTYGKSERGPWKEAVPETNGVFYVRAYIPETTDWAGAEKTKRFLIYKSFDELFTDFVDISPDYTGEALNNQVVLVAISEQLYPGFSYARCGGAENLAFMNQPGSTAETPLSYEVDTWNESGTSYVWVKVPNLVAGKTTFRMYWHLKDGMAGPGPDAGEVWRNYVGVWHFGETISSTVAASTPSLDSTDNGYHAVPHRGKAGTISQMKSDAGVIGNARVNATAAKVTSGNHLVISNFMGCALGTSFVFEGWVQLSYTDGAPWIFARKDGGAEGGFALALDSTDHKKLDLYGSGTTYAVTPQVAGADPKGNWQHLTLAVSGGSYWVYTQSKTLGRYSVTGSLPKPVGEEGLPLSFGSDATGGVSSVNGKFDEFRLRTWNPATEPTDKLFAAARATYTNTVAAESFLTHGWVVKEGQKQNYWVTRPSISKTRWDEGDVSVAVDVGQAAIGDVALVYRNLFKPEETWPTLPTKAGDYVASFTVEVEGFDALAEEIGFTIVGHKPYSVLGATEQGRTLLANDDSRGDWGELSITNQSYWQTRYVDVNCSSNYVTRERKGGKWIYITNWVHWVEIMTNNTYWTHNGESTDHYRRPFLLTNSVHTLETTNKIAALCGSSLIWRLEQVRFGNLYTEDSLASEWSTMNYLPWSSTSCSISSNGVPFTKREVGNLMMRNSLDARIISPCYTNGIGTIYFDAVNANVDGKPQNYKLLLEVATNVIGSAAIPTDENVLQIIVTTNNLEDVEQYAVEPDITVTTNLYGLANWYTVPLEPHKFVNGTHTLEAQTTELALNMQNGGTHQNFYRVVAVPDVRTPARFRIRRVSVDPDHDVDADRDAYGQILMDNIIVSKPRDWGEVMPEGLYDSSKRGKQVLGYENTWSVPFPSINDGTILARAKPVYHVQLGTEDTATAGLITKTTMYYRERYLGQRVETPFKSVVLNPYDDFRALEPLKLSGLVSDVDFYFVSNLQAPYYQYVDYSGTGYGVPEYTEELQTWENRCKTMTAAESPSRGTDWFVRLREGRSDTERMVLQIEGRDPIDMEVVADHIWRGYLKTVEGVKGGVRYRIEPRNVQVAGERGFSVTTNFWYARDDVNRMPVSTTLLTDGTTNSYARIPCDGYTGYLMFQVDDATKSISIVHADYQDFNMWDDAKSDSIFKGSSEEDGKKSGVSPKKQEFDEKFLYHKKPSDPLIPWTNTPSTNVNWQESLDTAASQEYGDYVPFGESTTLGGWKVGPGMYVCQWYRHTGSIPSTGGMPRHALQMEGCGKGWVQFPPNPTPVPRGIGTVSFTARVGQFISPDDDIAYAEYPSDKTYAWQNYTFVTLAAFDLKENKGFAGDASLSLFAYYRHRRGCYEVRLEQLKAAVNAAGVTGPANDRRISLYRWTRGSDGSLAAKLLGSKDYSFTPIKTAGENGNYMPMYISCQNESGATVIKFGIQRKDNNGKEGQGFPWNEEISRLASQQFYSFVYRDTSASRLTMGTYGVLSANCNAYFLRPHIGMEYVPTSKTDKDKLVEDSNPATVSFPAFVECKQDIADPTEPWNLNPARMERVYSASSQSWWGFCASPVSQKLILETSPRGQSKWTEAASFTFNDFGSSSSPGKACEKRLDRSADHDVRLRVDGEVDDARTDVIVDNLEVTQWRGCDYGDPDTTDFLAEDDGYGWRTNFTFSSAWVTGGALRLSPKRTSGWTDGAKVCGIRSPLMDGAGNPKRGIGLGLIAFEYKNAQANAKLLVQIATNGVGSSALGYDTIDDKKWTTVTNADFTKMTATQRKSGRFDVYLGLHGVKGLMRIIADPSVVQQVSPDTWLDQTKYGEVDITHVYCRDEPLVDLTAWWGWNLQTTDNVNRQYLVDNLTFGAANGLSLGLNSSTTESVEDDPETYKRQMPFVQTPSFVSNTVGEITFRARKYDLYQTQNAEITLYGATYDAARQGLEWHCSPTDKPLVRFVVSNATYTTYSYKTKPGESYKAFRLGVSGIKAVDYQTRGPDPTQGEKPVRVLIDEVVVSEAIRPEVGFRYCCPIRNGLASAATVLTARDRDEQPILGDAWSVQAEIEVKLLPDEIDLKTHKPKVFFHWFCGTSPWGFGKWRDDPKAGTAELALAEGEDMIFRGSYVTAPKAVITAEPTTASYTYRIYQYAAEVVYYDIKGNCITGILDKTEWTRPEWYAPLDLNARYGGADTDSPFAAYNILEHVSPGRAWINEVNVFDGRDASYNYPAEKNQYVEIAVPLAQSLRNWKLYYVDNNIKTNLLCVFGQESVADQKSVNTTNNYAFVTVQSKETERQKTLDASKGEVDGTWQQFDSTDRKAELDQTHPIGFFLMRPSGILAQEIVLEGTNTWASTAYAERYSAKKRVEKLNETDPEKQWYLAGNEYGGKLTTSLGVTNTVVDATRASAVVPQEAWTSRGTKTPGRCNEGQVIPEDYAIYPCGDMVLVNATIVGPHIRQSVGEETNTIAMVMVATKRSAEGEPTEGTNITYHLDQWYEIAEIRENNVLKASGGGDGFVFTAAKNASESVVTVTATARPRKDLREKYGLNEQNPYSDAVIRWLEGGETLKGRKFANPGNIDLPIFRDYSGNYVGDLTLTETYWFDIDPTGSNWCYRAGTVGIPGPYEYDAGGVTKTNVRIVVYMAITNESAVGEQAGLNWSPYVLRGKIPDTHSQQYAAHETNSWDAVNFKITADLLDGLPLRAKWIPLRYFVFKDGSFDANHLSTIDIPHPFSSDSLSVNYGWHELKDTYKGSIGYKWSIDGRVAPVAIETLCPTNAITW